MRGRLQNVPMKVVDAGISYLLPLIRSKIKILPLYFIPALFSSLKQINILPKHIISLQGTEMKARDQIAIKRQNNIRISCKDQTNLTSNAI